MICANPSARELCVGCREQLPAVPAPAEVSGVPVLAACQYRAPIDASIHRLKYENRPDLARPLARFIHERVRLGERHEDAWLVPVPLHGARLAERGYNQSALVARTLSTLTKLRSAPRALVRIRDTAQQAHLDRDARRANVRDAFAARQRLHGRKVMLVDDVLTTGATAEGAIAALTEAGAEVIAIVAIARAGDA
jgi:ComF family protein